MNLNALDRSRRRVAVAIPIDRSMSMPTMEGRQGIWHSRRLGELGNGQGPAQVATIVIVPVIAAYNFHSARKQV